MFGVIGISLQPVTKIEKLLQQNPALRREQIMKQSVLLTQALEAYSALAPEFRRLFCASIEIEDQAVSIEELITPAALKAIEKREKNKAGKRARRAAKKASKPL